VAVTSALEDNGFFKAHTRVKIVNWTLIITKNPNYTFREQAAKYVLEYK
jgi:hypothetical protein